MSHYSSSSSNGHMEWWKQKWMVIKILMKYCYLKVLQHVYMTVTHLHKNTYEIQYTLHDKIYKIRTKVKRGPSKIICIMDHEGQDITDDVRSYLGPNEDFHGQTLYPKDMGYERICVCLRNGDHLDFEAGEAIVF